MTYKYAKIFGWMVVLHLFLFTWKALLSQYLSVSEPFEMKMLTMSGMGVLSIAIFLFARIRKTDLSILPKHFDLIITATILLSVVVLVATAVFFTRGTKEIGLLLYGCIVTPLFEELLFRGYFYRLQEQMHSSRLRLILFNALLFSIWHLGYIVQPLAGGEWMALSKLPIAFVYGLPLAAIRSKTNSTLCTFLTHGALNALLG